MMGIDRITMIWSGAVLSWASLRDDGSPANFIHRSLSREVWRESSLAERLLLLAAYLARPITIPATTAVFTYYNGAAIKRRTGKGIARQAWEQIAVAATHSIPSAWYYMF